MVYLVERTTYKRAPSHENAEGFLEASTQRRHRAVNYFFLIPLPTLAMGKNNNLQLLLNYYQFYSIRIYASYVAQFNGKKEYLMGTTRTHVQSRDIK